MANQQVVIEMWKYMMKVLLLQPLNILRQYCFVVKLLCNEYNL